MCPSSMSVIACSPIRSVVQAREMAPAQGGFVLDRKAQTIHYFSHYQQVIVNQDAFSGSAPGETLALMVMDTYHSLTLLWHPSLVLRL